MSMIFSKSFFLRILKFWINTLYNAYLFLKKILKYNKKIIYIYRSEYAKTVFFQMSKTSDNNLKDFLINFNLSKCHVIHSFDITNFTNIFILFF